MSSQIVPAIETHGWLLERGGLGLAALILVMRLHADTLLIQEHGVAVLRQLARLPKQHPQLRAKGAIEAVASAMDMFWDEDGEPVQTHACAFFANMARATDSVPRIVKTGLEPIVSAMMSWPENAVLQASGCAVLQLVCQSRADGHTDVVKRGGLQVLAAAMLNLPHAETVQEHGCAALHALLPHFSRHSTRLCELGIIDILVSGVMTFDSLPVLQEHGVACLSAMAAIAPDQFIACGGVDALVSALHAHPDKVSLVQRACEGLVRVVHLRVAAVTLIALNGLALLAAAMLQHPTSLEVQERGAIVLSAVASVFPSTSAAKDAVPAIVTAVTCHAKASTALCASSCRVIQYWARFVPIHDGVVMAITCLKYLGDASPLPGLLALLQFVSQPDHGFFDVSQSLETVLKLVYASHTSSNPILMELICEVLVQLADPLSARRVCSRGAMDGAICMRLCVCCSENFDLIVISHVWLL
jgi:hypothetical protein